MAYRRYPFLVVACFLLTAEVARADNLDAKERAARTACLAGDYTKGAALLSELFVATKDAGFIYNQGRCFEQNHRYEDAIARFQEYLRVGKKIRKADKVDTRKHIADCQDLLAKQSGSQIAPGSGSGNKASATIDRAATKEAKERAAKKACLTGDAVTGVAILTDLYLDTSDTTYLFNQGRCFEQNRRYEDAVGRFREFLVKAKDLTAEEKSDTDKHIAACDSYVHGSKPAEMSKPAAEPPPNEQRTLSQITASSPAESSSRTGAGLRAAGLVVAGVGVAGLVTGVILNVKVNSMSSDLEADWNTGKNSTRQGYKTAGWIAYGAGAACVAGGAVLYYLGWQREERAASVALLPSLAPEMTGAVVAGAF